ncbi:uncharacterized protein LOC109801966 [Cajanus cajan]|uniref:uncharacterized protein LOC109801966 n=1 Tax=Cajanus cajan TaxID=3821 RepID=UPI00098DAB5C|nr:uncharacterized protein LOC109801966 [Cajanus cajan]
MASPGPILSISGTPTITTEKLNGKNYLSWAASVELWFLGQGYHDHLEMENAEGSDERQAKWKKLDFQLCVVLWQSVEPNILGTLRAFKTCCSFWKKAQNIYANDIQWLYDAAQKIASLKQINHEMTSHIAEAQAAVEELKMFLTDDSLEGINKKLDRLYMVLILRTLHPDLNHVRDQILTGHEIPSMDSLITRLLRVPTEMKNENSGGIVEVSAMVSSQGRGGRGNRGGRGGRSDRPQCSYCKRMGHIQENCYSLHGFPEKIANLSKSEKLGKSEMKVSEDDYQEYLQWKSMNQAQSSSTTTVSTTCISHSTANPSPWIIDSGASNHITGTWYGSEDWRRT